MRDIAQRDLLAKDPQFSLTLPVWLAAGCRIDHVIATFRSVDEMIQSRLSARQFGYKNIDDARNALLLANGTLTSTLADHTSLAHVTLRFPDFIYDLNATAQALPLIGDMKRSTLARALTEVVRSAG